jgi:AmiR/NasT family two-component response regulator
VWDVRALLRADATAQQTARVLALWLRVSDLTRELGRTDSELVTAAVTRDVVEQAVGALMALHHCTAEEASAHLEAEADRTGSDVADVAAALLDGLSDPR